MLPALRMAFAGVVAIAAVVLAGPVFAVRDAIPAPESWRRESFEFPLAFAPSIGLEGAEHVRFAPGWSDFASDRGFRYVFLWEVKDIRGPALEVHGLEFALGVYFDGLMAAAAEARRIDAAAPRTVANFHPMRDVPGWSDSYAADIHTWNAFSRGEALKLNAEVTRRTCSGGIAQIFYAVARAARDHPLWDDLRRLRQATNCPPV